jgi:hypothetical protein
LNGEKKTTLCHAPLGARNILRREETKETTGTRAGTRAGVDDTVGAAKAEVDLPSFDVTVHQNQNKKKKNPGKKSKEDLIWTKWFLPNPLNFPN